jgi:lipid-A-disaccharide synthase-like uncharacterized protein
VFQAAFDWVSRELHRPLVLFGFAAQFVFFLRFVVQWYESERRGRSHIPLAFWYLSLLGGVMILVYAALEKNLVFTCASALSLLIYIRNLMLIYGPRYRRRRRHGA